jgi:hypothetical protein
MGAFSGELKLTAANQFAFYLRHTQPKALASQVFVAERGFKIGNSIGVSGSGVDEASVRGNSTTFASLSASGVRVKRPVLIPIVPHRKSPIWSKMPFREFLRVRLSFTD